MVSFTQVSPPKSSLSKVLHAPPISFYSILLPEQYWVNSRDHEAPHYVIFSTPCYLVPLRPKYPPLHPILTHPQPTFLPHCERPSFTQIHSLAQPILPASHNSFYLPQCKTQSMCLQNAYGLIIVTSADIFRCDINSDSCRTPHPSPAIKYSVHNVFLALHGEI